jgi:hypothetical protein
MLAVLAYACLTMKAQNMLTEIMNEHVEFPGFPQIITTRGFVYQWLKACGWKANTGKFDSLDYTVFARKVVDLPLYDEASRDNLLAQVRRDYLRGGRATV